MGTVLRHQEGSITSPLFGLLLFFNLTFLVLFVSPVSTGTLRYVPQADPVKQYLQERNTALEGELKRAVGGQIELNDKEKLVNNILMKKKIAELNESLEKGKPYPPSIHFFKAKPLIDKSEVFRIIKLMPKGGALHLHDVSVLSLDWLVANVTYRDHCYMCYIPGARMKFQFSGKPPVDAGCSWKLVNDERRNSGNPVLFDQWLYNNLSLIVPDPTTTYPTEDVVWEEFEAALLSASGLIFYTPVFREYVYRCLQQFNEDNVQYMEIRTLMTPTYELDGSLNPALSTLEIYRNVSRLYVQDHAASFSGIKLIYSSLRHKNGSDIGKDLAVAASFREKFPDFMVGYDLVGQEDKGHALVYFLKQLLETSKQPAMPYFFHAGETDWQGTSVDENLIDAVLLNTSRIGHGYALLKHPWALDEVVARGIALEVNPISNQVLGLLSDLRDHPAAAFIARGLPVVISSDDPSVWGAQGLSYDFYQAFMGLSGGRSDLRLLKQLAINSLKFSAMSAEEKKVATDLWQTRWQKFLDDVIHTFTHEDLL